MTPLRTVPRLLLALALLGALALAHALTLEETFGYAEARPNVQSARRELEDARAAAERTARDPLAVRADLVQAEQRVALAEAALESARYTALQELGSAYTGVLGARAQRDLARMSVAVSEAGLRIAHIRLQNGSATRLDLADAEVALEEARSGLRAAEEGLELALASLRGLLGEAGEGVTAAALAGIPERYLVAPPPLGRAQEAAARHPDLLAVRQQLELAELSRAVLDPLYAPRAQIASAELQLQGARSGLAEARRGFELQIRGLYNQLEAARSTLEVAEQTLAGAEARLKTQRQRFEAGLIAEIELQQTELQAQGARTELQSARQGLLTALLELQAGTLVNLGGPFAALAPDASAPESDETRAQERP
ncbi:TolC family protein [Truepera radiovictrix]|uniref:Outer membrane efflux protein n=1 Tax=Truepera radiovictrix (strain DSM 17093 / CIP 108686 / LMG 22925 / RQ-24) TaxID=649638 RepID=D7CW39_TRURR|nr:TolC family protein [Truepera radiovictrix]ADI14302.1 outer membrane efflux protein [Truepera radiovictrix DSM 17093]WMT57142.1 TolC family protein [Truepera radiovictrix]